MVDEYFEELAREAQTCQDMVKAIRQNSERVEQAIRTNKPMLAMKFNHDVMEGITLLSQMWGIKL